MSQVDEGLIHAWLDGQLSAEEAAHVEKLVAKDAEWAAAAAEARGLVAGASRALGALDDVASARGGAASVGARRAPYGAPRRAWYRAPWIGAAAAVVLVAGTATVIWQSDPGVTVIATEPVPVADSAPRLATVPASELSSGGRAPAVEARRQTAAASADDAGAARGAARDAARDTAGAAGRGAVTDLRSELATPPASSGAQRNELATAKAADFVRPGGAGGDAADTLRAAAGRGAVRGFGVGTGSGARGGGRGADVGQTTGVRGLLPPPRAAATVEQGVMGQPTTLQRAAGDSLVRTVDALIALDACWAPIDSASVASVRGMPPTDTGGVFVLRFERAAMTDAAGRDAEIRGRAARDASAAQPPARSAPPGARVQHTFPRQFTDTSFVTEWIVGDAHRQMYFTVRGETLRATTVKIYGDMVVVDAPLTATRVRCPP